MKEIKLTQGKVAVVDDEDYELLSRYKWFAHKHKNGWYACRSVRRKPATISMHCVILGLAGKRQVDHINGDGLDNQRTNLRRATVSQNSANRTRLSTNTSGFRGVTFHKQVGKWQAVCGYRYKNYYLGLFSHAADAARAYDSKARELFGEYARPNFELEA